jgi:O-antigen/teichoic acid export membrane protein
MKSTLLQIYTENRTYGFHVYVGVLASVATASLMGLLVGYFENTVAVGFYSLALTVTMPLGFIPSALGTTLFKTFADRTSIPKKVVFGTVALTGCALTVFLLLIDKVVMWAYSAEYSEVIPLAYIMAIGSVLHGFGDFVNRFLGAHGRGKQLRNGAFITGGFIMAGSLTLVPAFGALGAAFTKVIAGGLYCASMCHYYRKTQV